MSFPKYDRYKDSGVERLGEVPEHWEIGSLKRGFQIVGGSTPKSEQESYWDGAIVWVTPADLSKLSTMYISDSSRKITSAGLLSCGTTMVPAGSIVISTRAPIGSLAISERELCTNQGCKSLVALGNRCYSSYYGYLLSVSTIALNIRGKGTTFLELSSDELGAFNIPYPPLPEQRSIAAFLDRETTKIDELIAEQRQLIDLLKEKRQAVISHAVTKGLNPDAPMKDSAIEWLGEVPEHWSKPSKLVDFSDASQHSFVNGPFGSDLLSSELTQEGIPVIYIRDLKPQGYTRVSEVCVTREKAEQIKFCNVIPGDILVAKVGDPPGLAVVYPTTEGEGIVTQDVIRLRLNKESATSSYVSYLLNSDFGRISIDTISVESTRTRVGLGDYKQLKFCIPPFSEQQSIVTFLDVEAAKLNDLVDEAQYAINLLQERRTALISAAVTGKIDVRSFV